MNFAAPGRRGGKKKQKTANQSVLAATSSKSSSPPSANVTGTLSTPVSRTLTCPMYAARTYTYCSWIASGVDGCDQPAEILMKCFLCDTRIHSQCQVHWELVNGFRHDNEADKNRLFCFLHHPSQRNNASESDTRVDDSSRGGSDKNNTIPTPAVGSSCDWMPPDGTACAFSLLPTKVCGVDHCNKPVHHVCQINWETENNVPELEGGKLRCREHHPNCNHVRGVADGKQSATSAATATIAAGSVPHPLPPPGRTTTISPLRSVMNFLTDRLPLRLNTVGDSTVFGSSPANSTLTGGVTATAAEVPDNYNYVNATVLHHPIIHPVEVGIIDEEEEIDDAFWDDLNCVGDGADSDQDGEVSLLHNDAVLAKAMLSTLHAIIDKNCDDIDHNGELSDLTLTVAALPLLDSASTTSSLRGALALWNPPAPPDNWTSYEENEKKFDAPDLHEIDNPGLAPVFISS